MLLGVIAVIALFCVIAAKYLTTVGLQNLRQRVAETEAEARKARSIVKAAENEKATVGRGINTKDRKRRTLQKSIEKARKELAELKK